MDSPHSDVAVDLLHRPPTTLGKGWKDWSGFDANSGYTIGKPTGLLVIVRPNQYEAGRANIAVYNWDRLGCVSVTLTALGEAPEASFANAFLPTQLLTQRKKAA